MEDIKPIDKFTLDKYVREEDDLLEYVEMLGCKCHPDYDFIRVKKETEDKAETNETEEVAAAEEEEEETPMQLVFSGGTKEMLEVDAHTLFYVEAEGNYIRVAYSSADKMQQKLVRATMKQAEEAVAACPFIVRCHRAFLVNIRTVVKVDGNSQGYRLRLEGCTEEVPVSRGYAKEIKTLIEGGAEG